MLMQQHGCTQHQRIRLIRRPRCADPQDRTGYRLEVATVRKLETESDAFAFGDKLIEKWYGTVEKGSDKGILLVVTTNKDGALTGGPKFLKVPFLPAAVRARLCCRQAAAEHKCTPKSAQAQPQLQSRHARMRPVSMQAVGTPTGWRISSRLTSAHFSFAYISRCSWLNPPVRPTAPRRALQHLLPKRMVMKLAWASRQHSNNLSGVQHGPVNPFPFWLLQQPSRSSVQAWASCGAVPCWEHADLVAGAENGTLASARAMLQVLMRPL